MVVCHVCLPCLLLHAPGNCPRSSCPSFSAKLGLTAAAAPDGALHEIDLEAHVGQAQSAGGGIDHSQQRDHGKSAIPGHGHPVVGGDDLKVRLEISEAFSGDHRGHGKNDDRETNTDLPWLHCGNLPLEFDRTFIPSAASASTAALVLAEGSGHPRRMPVRCFHARRIRRRPFAPILLAL